MDKPLVPIKRLKPTIKQLKTLQHIKEGDSQRQAMIKAGYSLETANRGGQFFKHKRVINYVQGLKEYILNTGLTNEKMADKFKEWINAQKVHTSHTEPDRNVPDYDTQIKAFKEWKDIMGLGGNGEPKVKRRLTIDEFLNDETE